MTRELRGEITTVCEMIDELENDLFQKGEWEDVEAKFGDHESEFIASVTQAAFNFVRSKRGNWEVRPPGVVH